jgi:hypothetical protein
VNKYIFPGSPLSRVSILRILGNPGPNSLYALEKGMRIKF